MTTSLVEAARELAQARYIRDRHQMFSALRASSGKLYSGVHLEASNGRVAVCAEAIAIGAAASAGETAIDTIVAVTESGDVVPPCGICRELLRDYAPQAHVILQVDGALRGVPVSDLLPFPYRSGDYPNTRTDPHAVVH